MDKHKTQKIILVTDGSGFIAVHTTVKLLQKGYKVRVTLRTLFRKMKMPASFLGQNIACSNEKAKTILGWRSHFAEEAVVATAESMFQFGVIK